ncbi:MAG: hypothetical protein AABX88_00205 [Nanoarchaeota archaeon]
MIRNAEPISMAEASEYIAVGKEHKEGETDVKGFIKKFVKLSAKDAKEMRKVIVGLGLMKIRDEHVPKIIDIMPENAEDLNKIFNDMGLDEDETKKILETVKQFK